jgi:hypothetical protein
VVWLILPMFSFWWVVLVFVFFVLTCVIIELDEEPHPTGAAWTLFFFCLLAALLSDMTHLVVWLFHHPGTLIFYGLLYVIFGFSYGVFRWWWDQTKALTKYDEMRAKFFKKCNLLSQEQVYSSTISIPDTHLAEWKLYVERYRGGSTHKTFLDCKGEITSRMSFWIFSLAAFVCKDFLAEISQRLLNRFRKIFIKIEESVWQKTIQDFRESTSVITKE